jgi:threonine dehydratase
MKSLSIKSIQDASHFLERRIRKTPLEHSAPLSKLLGAPTYLKLEFLQLTGSFKIRGAYIELSQLSYDNKKKGVITCSAGNHGKALAYVAKELKIPATIYVPKNVDQAKYEGMVQLGANVIRTDFVGYDETEAIARTEARKKGKKYISAFDDEPIMVGNGGTLALEVCTELPAATNFILPVGGGGLAGGFSFYVKENMPHAKIIACQLKDSPALKLSLESGYAVTKLPAIETLAGGIEGGIGEKCFEVLKSRIEDVVLIEEEEISKGVLWMLKHHQYLIEPTAAVVISACINGKIKPLSSPTVIILTGRNVSYSTIKNLLN